MWDLLAKSPTTQAGPNFVSDTVRLARLTEQDQPWWKRLWKPSPANGLVAVFAACLVFMITGIFHILPDSPSSPEARFDSPQAETIQDIAETEVLIAAADNPGDFSDQELACLLGF